ncbi:MAG: hypothetical protein ACK5LF_23620, partial [Bacteroides xylanisolvens]
MAKVGVECIIQGIIYTALASSIEGFVITQAPSKDGETENHKTIIPIIENDKSNVKKLIYNVNYFVKKNDKGMKKKKD